MLHYPKLKIKTAYKTCLNFVSNSFVFLKLVKRHNQKNLPSTIPPGFGSLPSKASTRCMRKLSLKKRNLQHPEIGLHHIINPLPLKYTTPPLSLVNKGYHTSVTKNRDWPTSRAFTRHWLSLRPRTGTLAALGSSIYPPHRLRRLRLRLRVVAKSHASVSTPHWNPLLASPPNRYGSLLLPSFLHHIALAPGLLSYLHRELLAAGSSVLASPHTGSWNPVFLASLNPLLGSTWVSCQLMLVLRV